MERVPICLVGCGGMGQRHVLGYKALADTGVSNVEIVAVCDMREENALRVAGEVERQFGRRPAVHTDLEAVVADPAIQAIDLVTDSSTHHTIAVPALRAGKHVICEKPLGITVRACQLMLAAAREGNAILATAENYRRDPVNRLARAVLDAGLLGQRHLMIHNSVGGDDHIIITPWRHLKDKGAIGLDMGVHYLDIVQYYLGEFDQIYGRGLIAEPVRRRRPQPENNLESYQARFASIPETMEATGEDSIIALYRMKSGVMVQFSYVPSGPGYRYFQRSVHGRQGSMAAPGDRNGRPVVARLGDREVSGADLLAELPDFQLDEVTARLFGERGVVYEQPFAQTDAALLAIEFHDFGEAILNRRAPEVDGYLGMTAVAAAYAAYESAWSGRAVTMAEVLSGEARGYQAEIDDVLGLAAPAS